MSTSSRARWAALAVVCTGSLMNVLDTTIVGVALPAIRHDLGFSQASLACGLAPGQAFLLAARAIQGLGGAVASAVALSLVVSLFPEPGERARAMGVCSRRSPWLSPG